MVKGIAGEQSEGESAEEVSSALPKGKLTIGSVGARVGCKTTSSQKPVRYHSTEQGAALVQARPEMTAELQLPPICHQGWRVQGKG